MIAVREKIRVESLSLGGITKAALLSRSWGKSAFYNWEILSFLFPEKILLTMSVSERSFK